MQGKYEIFYANLPSVCPKGVGQTHRRGGEERLGWAGLFGVAQSAAQCNGIYCNLHFNAQMSFLYALNVN